MAFINFGMANTLAQAKASTNKNKLFFPTDSKKIAIDGKEYGGLDGVDIESKNSMYGVVGNGNNITDGVAAIKGIKGNTIVWNQLIKDSNFSKGSRYWSGSGNISIADNVLTLEVTVTSGTYVGIRQSFSGIVGHKYFIDAKISTSNPTGGELYINVNNSSTGIYAHASADEENVFKRVSDISTCTLPGSTVNIGQIEAKQGVTLRIKNPRFIDLTLIYGSGNEPTSVEQFEADYQRWFGKPLGYEPYDAGSLRNVMMSAIKTTGFNQYNPTTGKANVFAGLTYYIGGAYSTLTINGEIIAPINRKFTPSVNGEVVVSGGDNTTVINVSNDAINGQYKPYWNSTKSIPVTQLTGKLNGQGESITIFPDGMKRAGNIHDEIFVDNGVVKAIKRVGAVDMGTLSWDMGVPASSTYATPFFATLPKKAKAIGRGNTWDTFITTKGYLPKSAYDFGYMQDKTLCTRNGEGRVLIIGDNSYSSAASFKAAMQGVMLYYELAEPQVYVLDDDVLPLMYKVDELGTEQVLPECTEETPCCAPELDIRYRITPVEVLDNFSKVTNNKQVKAVADNARILNRIVTWGGDGATVKDGGKTINDLLPVSLTIDWSTDVLQVSEYSNFKDTPNAVVCNFLGSIIPMTFCYDQIVSKLIGMFVTTNDIVYTCQDEAGVYLNVDEMYVLQIDAEWDAGNLQDLDTISIRKMDGTYVYSGGDDSSSSGSGSEPYNDWIIDGSTPDGTSILGLFNFNYIGGATISMITCCPEGSDDPIFATGSGTGEYPKDVFWDSTYHYWFIQGGFSTEGTYVLKAYNASYNVVSEIQIVIV